MADVVDIDAQRAWQDRFLAAERRESFRLRLRAGSPPKSGPFADRPRYCVACGCRWAAAYAWRNGILDGHCLPCAETSWGGMDQDELDYAGATLLDLAAAVQEEIDRRRV